MSLGWTFSIERFYKKSVATKTTKVCIVFDADSSLTRKNTDVVGMLWTPLFSCRSLFTYTSRHIILFPFILARTRIRITFLFGFRDENSPVISSRFSGCPCFHGRYARTHGWRSKRNGGLVQWRVTAVISQSRRNLALTRRVTRWHCVPIVKLLDATNYTCGQVHLTGAIRK